MLNGKLILICQPMKTIFKLGDRVVDTWYPEAGTGIITKILKTRIKVYFERVTFNYNYRCLLFIGAKENGELTYDTAHYKFLKHDK